MKTTDLFTDDLARARACEALITQARKKERARLHELLADAERDLLVILARYTCGDAVDLRDGRSLFTVEVERAGITLDRIRAELGVKLDE